MIKQLIFIIISCNAKLQNYIPGYFPHMRTSSCKYSLQETNNKLPESWNWIEHNAVTHVKNQGNCGSCWSFSATGAMEGAYAIKTGKLVNISEQQLIDCSIKYGNLGCGGGLYDHAFEYATDHYMCLEKDEPYEGKLETCSKCPPIYKLDGCADVKPNNQTLLKMAVAQQPVSVAIEADKEIFQTYEKGVLKSRECGTEIDHAVLIVGYGNEDGTDYWLVKNSWGTDWGDNGYIKILRDETDTTEGICGIASQPSFPVLIVNEFVLDINIKLN